MRGGGKPRLVFSSSVAVFGGDVDLPMPRVIHDDTLPVPQTSYGIQKFICEQLVADYYPARLDRRPQRAIDDGDGAPGPPECRRVRLSLLHRA